MARLVGGPMDVEDLVQWALIDNGLASAFTANLQQLRWEDYGTVISTSDRWSVGAPRMSHTDAARVAGAIDALPPDPVTGQKVMTELVVRFGRRGERPDWVEEGVGAYEQMKDARGRLMWIWDDPNNRSAARSGRRPRMRFTGETQASVDFYRAQYDVWWIALKSLVAPLNGVMAEFRATGPRAPEKPWLLPRAMMDGKPVMGLHGNGSAQRLAALGRRGPLEDKPNQVANVHSSESAGAGAGHRRP